MVGGEVALFLSSGISVSLSFPCCLLLEDRVTPLSPRLRRLFLREATLGRCFFLCEAALGRQHATSKRYNNTTDVRILVIFSVLV
jgi:hypothetical protein